MQYHSEKVDLSYCKRYTDKEVIIMLELTILRHAYPEKAGFTVRRPKGHRDNTFLHFHNSVNIFINGTWIKTQPHAVIIYRPGTPQFFSSDIPLVHDWMHFRGDGEAALEAVGLQPDTLYYPAEHSFITKLVGELEREFYGKHFGRERLLTLEMEELMLKLGRSIREGNAVQVSSETKEAFRHLRADMLTLLDVNWTVEKMAQRVHLSPSRVYPIYKKLFGISPNADLINARINSAKNRLINSGDKIEDIAESLGYRNITHFIRQFKENTGMSPGQYRKNRRLE